MAYPDKPTRSQSVLAALLALLLVTIAALAVLTLADAVRPFLG